MSTTAIEGVVAAGHVPTWIIPAASVTTDPTTASKTLPLSALTGATAVKIDCHYDFGDVSVSRSEQTRARQRACQVVAETIKTGETIDITINAVHDQQSPLSEAVNEAYAALPEGADVYVAQAFGWDSSLAPTAETVIDLYKGKVRSRMKNQPTSPEEDLKFAATIGASAYWDDVTLTA